MCWSFRKLAAADKVDLTRPSASLRDRVKFTLPIANSSISNQ